MRPLLLNGASPNNRIGLSSFKGDFFMNLILSNAFDFSYVFKTVTTKWYYYVFSLAFIIILFCLFFIKSPKKRNNLSKTQNLCYVAIFSALCTVTNIFDVKVNDEFQISLVATVGFIAGFLLGPKSGFSACFLGDLLGAIINPHGPYNPIIGIGTGFWGLIPGLAFSYFRGKSYTKTAISYAVSFLIISMGINTLGFCLMYPTRYTLETLLPLVPFKFLVAVCNFIISYLLLSVLKRTLPKSKFNLR